MASYDPVYISINDKPRAVLQVMDGLRTRHAEHAEQLKRRRWVPLYLFLAGLPFTCIDLALGYNIFFFLVTFCFWIAAVVVWVALRRARPGTEFPAHYNTARSLIQILRDDLDSKRNFFGHLDLTGAQQQSKLFREGANALGLAVEYYRDEWLNLKTKLYDGNMLRLSAVERVKVRKGYYKRNPRGKQKWKAPKFNNRQELHVRISVNPQLYDIVQSPAAQVGAVVGAYTIEELDMQGGIIRLAATAPTQAVKSADILAVLRLTYDMLKRKAHE